MDAQTFMLVFQGELSDGFDREQAKRNLIELFKLSQEKVEQLFSLPAVAVKKNLSHELAQRIQDQLYRHGLVTVILPMQESQALAVGEPEQGESEVSAAAAAPPMEAVSSRAESQSGDALPFRFEGRGGEYFKIWIVNILLSIITLGIYSAWAKVRNHRYFYSNTHLADHSFEYLANPVTILKGRIVAAIFLAGYLWSESFMPLLTIGFMLVFVVAFPWLVCKSMAFRNRNTAYRNIRFGFDGRYGGAFKAFVLWPLFGSLTLGLLMPYAIFRQKQFLVEHSRYGTSHFAPAFQPGDFYGIYLRALGIFLLAVLALMVPIVGPILAMIVYLFVFAYVMTRSTNLIYNRSTLEGHGFASRLEVGTMAWIHLSNWFIVAITLGLATPWAMVRLANYRARCLNLQPSGSIDRFVAAEEQNVSSLGEEVGDAFDMDIGL